MGYKTELQSNNADLQTILNKVNALPEAGGGGGGGSVETCTVVLKTTAGASSSYYPVNVAYTSVDDSGNVIGVNQTVSTSSVTITCVKGLTLAIKYKSSFAATNTQTNANLLFYTSPTAVFKLDDAATSATIQNGPANAGGSG